MANFFNSKGEILMPYDTAMLERTVAASNGKMKPGCKFRCTMYSAEKPSMWSLPCVFRASFVQLDEGVRIKYRVLPGAIVWLLMALPVAVLAALLAMNVAVEAVGAFGAIIGLVYFVYTFQRAKAIDRFERWFGK
jgi:hypothetical protein